MKYWSHIPSALFEGNVWQPSHNPPLHRILRASQEILRMYGCSSFCVTACDVYSRHRSSPSPKKSYGTHWDTSRILGMVRQSPWAGPLHYPDFTITLRHTTLGRTRPAEWSARRIDLCLITHKPHKIQTSMVPVGFKPAIRNSSKRAAAHLRCRPRGHWDRKSYFVNSFKSVRFKTSQIESEI